MSRDPANEPLPSDPRVLRLIHPDLFGRERSKQFPASLMPSLLHGVGYSKVSLIEGLTGTPLEGEEFPDQKTHPDLLAIPDPATARRPPWEPDAVWLLADLVEEGPSRLCSRTVLRDACAALKERGLDAVAAPEPEFYLLHGDDGRLPYSMHGTSYMTGREVDPDGAFGRLHRSLMDFGVAVTCANREFTPGQFEINMHHADALTAADNMFLLKIAVKELALGEGLTATFMPKPFTDGEGSGMHVHLSLWRDGVNAFASDDGGVSDLCRAFIGGIQSHARAISAFASPTVNSYKRFVPGSLTPTTASWGDDNRFCYLRIPKERGAATRVEVRGGDASANPYLLLAAIIQAGIDGIDNDLRPRENPDPLPRSLRESLDALADDDVLGKALAPELVSVFIGLKNDEIERSERTVTDWEWDHYIRRA